MPWEQFTRENALHAADPAVSIQRKGIFALNRTAYELLGKPEAVRFYFDREKRRVGLRQANPRIDAAYPVRANSKGSTFLITGTAFTKFYGIPTDTARRFPAWSEDSFLVFDIGEVST